VIVTAAWLACRPDPRDRPRPPDGSAEHTGLPPGPPCAAHPVTEVVRLTGTVGHEAGRFLDVADTDRDGCSELLVSEWAERDRYSDRVHLLQRPSTSGVLQDEAALVVRAEAWTETFHETPLLVPAWGQLLQIGVVGSWTYRVFSFDLGEVGSRGSVGTSQIDGRLQVPDVANSVTHLARCRVDDAPGVCVALFDHDPAATRDFAGYTWLLSEPLRGDFELVPRNVSRRYYGDPGDRAEHPHGGGDFDGDGRADLAIGAYNVDGARGAVAVLVDPPEGDHRVWDVATAVVRGTAPGVELGLNVTSGDLDGDGIDELVASAPFGVEDGVYVFRGPFGQGEERLDEEADWIVRDGSRDAWLGYGVAIGDFDGDGRADLAVGRPENYYFGTRPGSVGIWFAPPPGRLDFDGADLVLTSGSAEADYFGVTVMSGDFDGDGLSDLAIGAPKDTEGGKRTVVGHGVARGGARPAPRGRWLSEWPGEPERIGRAAG
jgi:hypothetical protein